MERCPICRGRITPEQTCRRCKADLSLLIQTDDAAEALTQKAIECLAQQHNNEAKALLKRALDLKYDPFISALYGFAVVAQHTDGGTEYTEFL